MPAGMAPGRQPNALTRGAPAPPLRGRGTYYLLVFKYPSLFQVRCLVFLCCKLNISVLQNLRS